VEQAQAERTQVEQAQVELTQVLERSRNLTLLGLLLEIKIQMKEINQFII